MPLKQSQRSSATAVKALRKASFAPDYYKDYKDENDALHIPNRMGFTTTKWTSSSSSDYQDAFDMMLEGGVPFCVCTPGTEAMLATAMANEPDQLEPIIAVTYNARFGGDILKSIETTLEKLDHTDEIELLQARPSRLQLKGLSGIAVGIRAAIDDGYCVSGGAIDITSRNKLQAMITQMENRDESLISNQFEYSLVNRKHEKMIKTCKKMGVIPLIRHPLGKDLLASGVWTSEEPNGSNGKDGPRFSYKVLEKYEPLHSMQYRILEKVQGRVGKGGAQQREMKDYRDRRYEAKKASGKVTAAQIAINYIVAKGGVPLVDVHDEKSAHEALGCLGWQLTKEEVEMLDQAAELSAM